MFSKYNENIDQLKDIKKNFTNSVLYIVTENISKVKDSITEALKEGNFNRNYKGFSIENSVNIP